MDEVITEFAVAAYNPISRHWIYGDPKNEKLAEKEFAVKKAVGLRCRLVKRQVTKWEILKESEVK